MKNNKKKTPEDWRFLRNDFIHTRGHKDSKHKHNMNNSRGETLKTCLVQIWRNKQPQNHRTSLALSLTWLTTQQLQSATSTWGGRSDNLRRTASNYDVARRKVPQSTGTLHHSEMRRVRDKALVTWSTATTQNHHSKRIGCNRSKTTLKLNYI